jgi:hypothetical protein
MPAMSAQALAPPGASPLLGGILLAIDLAASPADLRAWCEDHEHLLALLSQDELDLAASRRDCMLLLWQIEAVQGLSDLAAWWVASQALLRGLGGVDRAQVVAAKDARKAALGRRLAGSAPPVVVRPYRGAEAARTLGRLL